MPSFTDLFLEYTADAESPESFFRWSSYAAVAAVLRDNVWIDLGLKKVWPNIYVILMARSAALRKGTALQIAKDLISSIGNTRIISGRASIQAVIKDLSEVETHRDTGIQLKGASAILISEELASFAPEDPATIPLLTDLYDNHKEWTNSLKSEGKRRLENTCISMLAATNEPFFREVYTNLAIRGGLLGRTFIIREHFRRSSNSLMYVNKERYVKEPLVSSLKAVASLRGEIFLEDDARREYDEWYKSIDYDAPSNDTGVLERIHWGVLKVAILLGASTDYEARVKKCHVEEAIIRCMNLLRNYEVLTMSAGRSPAAEPGAILLAFLWEKGGCASHKDVLRSNWRHFDVESLAAIVQTLGQAGLLIETIQDGQAAYKLTPDGRRIFGDSIKR